MVRATIQNPTTRPLDATRGALWPAIPFASAYSAARCWPTARSARCCMSVGVPYERGFDELNVTQPALIERLHREYLAAGAELIESNTFGANRLRLALHGQEAHAADLNAQGVRLAPPRAPRWRHGPTWRARSAPSASRWSRSAPSRLATPEPPLPSRPPRWPRRAPTC